jgi:putative membrane protein
MRSSLSVYLKGFLMGAADTVPGVSGGTIALITGIYERLIEAITSVGPADTQLLLTLHTTEGRADLRDLFVRADGVFLMVLGFGIASAVLTLSRVLEHTLEQFPAFTAAFFFGLIGASAIVLYAEVDVGTPRRLAVALVGIVLAAGLSSLPESAVGSSYPVVFIAGAIAVCAMILPGVSGSFLLYVLNQYEYMITNLTTFVDGVIGLADGGNLASFSEAFSVVVTFCTGALLGLLTMARVVKWAFREYRAGTLTFLVSLMVGGLVKPASTIATEAQFGAMADIAGVVVFALIGGGLVLGVDFFTEEIDY